MPIKFNCPKCGQELNVKDDMAGKQGKCPKCKSTVTVPTPAAPRAAGAPPVRKKPVEEVEEVEEIEEAEVVEEDEPPRKRSQVIKKGKSDFDFSDEEDEDTRVASRRSSRRRDDDDEDNEPRRKKKSRRDDDEDDEDEPRRGKRASKRRRDEEDDYDEEDEGGSSEKRKKAKERARRVGFQRATTGMFLNFISLCAYTAAWGVLTLLFLIAYISLIAKSLPGEGLIKFMGYLSEGLADVALILCIVGGSFLILMPNKNGEMGLGIALVATAAISLILAIYLRFGEEIGAPLGMVVALASLGIPGSGGIGAGIGGIGRGIPAAIYFWVILEMGRLCLVGIYQWAVGNTIKDKGLASSSLVLGISVPSGVLAMGILFWLIMLIMFKAESKALFYIGGFFLLGVMAAWTGLLAWFTLHTMSVKDNMEHAR